MGKDSRRLPFFIRNGLDVSAIDVVSRYGTLRPQWFLGVEERLRNRTAGKLLGQYFVNFVVFVVITRIFLKVFSALGGRYR